MLNAFADQLRHLAETSYGQFRQEVKNRMNGKSTEEQVGALKEFIFLLPATLRQLNLYWNRKNTPPRAKKVCGFIMTYIYQPNDFISEKQHGLFGYLDDAYFVVQAYLQIHDHFLRDWHDKTPEELELTNRARRLIVAPRMVIPKEVARIDKMVSSLIEGDQQDFDKFMAENGER